MDISDPREIRAMNLMIKMACKFTPDYPVLLDLQAHLFFVVDDLQSGCRNAISDKYGCRAYTNSGFECYRESLTDKVIPFYGSRKPELVDKMNFARIKGEVHKVPTKQIPELDTKMRNGVQYKRTRILLLAPETLHTCVDNGKLDYVTGKELPWMLQGFKHHVSPERTIILRAWMYVAMRDYWNPIIDGLHFDRLEMQDSPRPWLRRYYQFNKRRNE